MLNRSAIILRYKEPAISYINDADPVKGSSVVTIAETYQDRTIYLIPDEDAEDQDALDRWVHKNYKRLFEMELSDWYTDPSLFPKNLTLDLFHEWFEVEWHSVVMDTVGGEIYDDEQ